jgi:hypothetical protein
MFALYLMLLPHRGEGIDGEFGAHHFADLAAQLLGCILMLRFRLTQKTVSLQGSRQRGTTGDLFMTITPFSFCRGCVRNLSPKFFLATLNITPSMSLPLLNPPQGRNLALVLRGHL